MKSKIFITLFVIIISALAIGLISEYLFPFTECGCSPEGEISNFTYRCYRDDIYVGYRIRSRYCNFNFCKSEYTVICSELMSDGHSRDYGVYHEDEVYCDDCKFGSNPLNPIGADGEPMWQ